MTTYDILELKRRILLDLNRLTGLAAQEGEDMKLELYAERMFQEFYNEWKDELFKNSKLEEGNNEVIITQPPGMPKINSIDDLRKFLDASNHAIIEDIKKS